MTRRVVAAIAAVLALFAGLAVAAAPFGLAVQRSGHWSRPTIVNVATGGGIALVGLLCFLFTVAALVSHLRRHGLTGPRHAAPTPPPPPPPATRPTRTAVAPTSEGPPVQPATGGGAPAQVATAAEAPAQVATPGGAAAQAAGGSPPAGRDAGAGERFPRRPVLPGGVLGPEWDGFLQPRTASPADLIQGVRAARDPDRDQPPLPTLTNPPPPHRPPGPVSPTYPTYPNRPAQPDQPAQPGQAVEPGRPDEDGPLASDLPVGGRPYIVGPYQVGRPAGARVPERPDNGTADRADQASLGSGARPTDQTKQVDQTRQVDQANQGDRAKQVGPVKQADQAGEAGQAGRVEQAEQADQAGRAKQTEQAEQAEPVEAAEAAGEAGRAGAGEGGGGER
jgi:hypothetical protein